MSTETILISPGQYLANERKRTEKFEYENGKVIPMGGASKEHNTIAGNIFGLLWLFVRQQDTPFGVYQADMRVHTPEEGKYYYPDVVVTKGKERFLDSEFDTLLNPLLIVEVLSDFTEARDRGDKFQAYRSIDSFREYLLVSQKEQRIEVFFKDDQDRWILRDPVFGANEKLLLQSIDLELALAEVYRGVRF